MNFPLPSAPASLMRNLRLLAEDWRVLGTQGRYFIASQVLSCVLMAACALGAIAAAATGQPAAYVGLIAACLVCLLHTVVTWLVLKRRFRVRYAIW